MKSHEFWRERATGSIWAVELLQGRVVGCCGPLARREIDERFLPAFDYSPERAPSTEADRGAFDVYDRIEAEAHAVDRAVG